MPTMLGTGRTPKLNRPPVSHWRVSFMSHSCQDQLWTWKSLLQSMLPNVISVYYFLQKKNLLMILKCHRRCQTLPCDVLRIEQLISVIYLYGFGQLPLLKSSSEGNEGKVWALGCVLNLYLICLQKWPLMCPKSEIKPAMWNIDNHVYSRVSPACFTSLSVSCAALETEKALHALYMQWEAILYWGACSPAFSLSKVWKHINNVQRTKP